MIITKTNNQNMTTSLKSIQRLFCEEQIFFIIYTFLKPNKNKDISKYLIKKY